MTEYDWKSFSFGSGKHSSRDEGMCVMEAVAYIAGEEHSDHPQCVCPVLSKFCRSWNDGLLSDAERNKWLGPFVWRLPGTFSPEHEELRRQMMVDWLCREVLPRTLDLVPTLNLHAEAVRCAPGDLQLIDAAWDAAGAAARAAAGDAAGDVLHEHVEWSKQSASDLFDRAIRLTEIQEVYPKMVDSHQKREHDIA